MSDKKFQTMEELATYYHNRDTPPKNIGTKTISFIEHKRCVVHLLMDWNCKNTLGHEDWRTLDIGWGQDLLVETDIDPEEIVSVSDEETLKCIIDLSNLPGRHADDRAYFDYVINHVRTDALVVKVADYIWNVEELLVGDSLEKAARYFEKAEPLFQELWRRRDMRAQWIRDDEKDGAPEIEDILLFDIMSYAYHNVDRLGQKIGAKWNWCPETLGYTD